MATGTNNDDDTHTTTMNAATNASSAAAAAHAGDDDDDAAVSTEQKKKDAMIAILAGQKQSIQACGTLDERRSLLVYAFQDDGKCFRPEFKTMGANAQQLKELMDKIGPFTKLTSAKQKKKWTGSIVAAHLYEFGQLVDKNDEGAKLRQARGDAAFLVSFRKLWTTAKGVFATEAASTEGTLLKNIGKFQSGTILDDNLRTTSSTTNRIGESCPFCASENHAAPLFIANKDEIDAFNQQAKDDKARELEAFNNQPAKKKKEAKKPSGIRTKGYIVFCICSTQHSHGRSDGQGCLACVASGGVNRPRGVHCHTCQCSCKAAFPIDKLHEIARHVASIKSAAANSQASSAAAPNGMYVQRTAVLFCAFIYDCSQHPTR
jgi:hypothetical protein